MPDTVLEALHTPFIFIITMPGECCYYSHTQIRKTRLREASETLSFIWSLMGSLVLTCGSLPGRDAHQLISQKAAPLADQAWPPASIRTGAARAVSRSCSLRVAGRPAGSPFLRALCGKTDLTVSLRGSGLHTMQLFPEHAAPPSAKLSRAARAKQMTSEPPGARLRELCGRSEVGQAGS